MTRFLLSLLLATSALGQPIVLEQIASGLAMPVAITHAGDSRLFITQQRGTIVIYDGVRVLPAPFLDIRNIVLCCNERGLLSAAFHPRYAENGFFYVSYTHPTGDAVIARYSRSATDPNQADSTTGVVLLQIPHRQFANHNGGQLQFGPDGYLYFGMGDGGSGGDPSNRAQNLAELLGKMLRIDVDSGSPYGIPPSNPFVNQAGARPEIWAYGLRNPWRFSFDRINGDLWIADVGQGLWEEVNFQRASSIGGENYGWRLMEGTHCFNPGSNCNNGSLVLPVIEYDHSQNACSVTGGYVYRGSKYPRLQGTYIYGDYCNGMIWGATRTSSGGVTTRVLTDTGLLISTFGEDAAGEIYVTDHVGGVLFHIADPNPLTGPRRQAVRHP